MFELIFFKYFKYDEVDSKIGIFFYFFLLLFKYK